MLAHYTHSHHPKLEVKPGDLQRAGLIINKLYHEPCSILTIVDLTLETKNWVQELLGNLPQAKEQVGGKGLIWTNPPMPEPLHYHHPNPQSPHVWYAACYHWTTHTSSPQHLTSWLSASSLIAYTETLESVPRDTSSLCSLVLHLI